MLPIGEIKQPNATLDLRESVDNEYLCLALARELGLAVPEAEIITTPRIRALAVTRFDRRWAQEGRCCCVCRRRICVRLLVFLQR